MCQAIVLDVRDIVLSNTSFGPQAVAQLTEAISSEYSQFTALRDAVAELESQVERSPASAVRLGVCYYLLGRFTAAVSTLNVADGGALAHFYKAKSQVELRKFPEAIESYQAAAAAGYNPQICQLGIAEVHRLNSDPTQALQTLDALSGPVEQTSEYLYQRGATVAALGGNPSEVIALYERGVEVNKNHAGALFGLALENDRRGQDEVALDLYQRAASRMPTFVGALLNLGVMYEDLLEFDKARQCYQRILDVFPGHTRARLFQRDAEASSDMYYDEEAQKKRDRLEHMLSLPVSDFELSVRSRNCLEKMGIGSLGDLARCSEQELLASKNFGETSLIEIREMLNSKGLHLGQFAHEKETHEPELDTSTLSADEQALLDRPISELNLSVRARKAMVRLGIATISELVRRTPDDMLECKNFGVTSLNEVREKLTLHSLKLRGD